MLLVLLSSMKSLTNRDESSTLLNDVVENDRVEMESNEGSGYETKTMPCFWIPEYSSPTG